MAVKVDMTGAGSIGEIVNWSVNEYATPVIPGEAAGGVGDFSITADATADSIIVTNNDLVLQTDIGNVHGTVRGVSESGIVANISGTNKLSILDSEHLIPSINSGTTETALELAYQLAGVSRLNHDSGVFWSLNGHDNGFKNVGINSDGTRRCELVNSSSSLERTYYFDGETNVYYDYNFTRDAVSTYSYVTHNNKKYATESVWGENVTASELPYVVAYKAFGPTNISFDGAFYSGGTQFLIQPSIWYDDFNSQLHVDLNDGNGFMWGTGTIYTPLIDPDNYVIFVSIYNTANSFGVLSANADATIANVDNLSVSYSLNVVTTDSNNRYDYFEMPWVLSASPGISGVRAIWACKNYPSTGAVTAFDYELPVPFDSSSTVTSGGPAIGARMNLWEYVQNACVAYHQEIKLVDDVVTVTDVAISALNIDNIIGNVSITPTTTLSGLAVNLSYNNAKKIDNRQVAYNAATSNNVLTVNTGETVKTTVTANMYLTSVEQPTALTTQTGYTQGDLPDGCYVVSAGGASGLPVAEDLWRNNGGRVVVSVNSENQNQIDITLVAPKTDIPAYAGPYSLALYDGKTGYAQLNILGSGLSFNNKTVSMQTGSPAHETSTAVAKTVSNPFIDTLERAYDSGIYATSIAAGPKVTISGSIPIDSIDGFGLTPGRIVEYRNSKYRVTDSSINNSSVSFNATRYVTAADFDTVWSGKNVNYHDIAWSGYDYQDQTILQLFNHYADGIFIDFDTDTVPYFNMVGDSHVIVTTDIDGNLYYSADTSLPSILLYLDTDGVPYF